MYLVNRLWEEYHHRFIVKGKRILNKVRDKEAAMKEQMSETGWDNLLQITDATISSKLALTEQMPFVTDLNQYSKTKALIRFRADSNCATDEGKFYFIN